MQLPPKVLQHVEVVLRPLAEAWYMTMTMPCVKYSILNWVHSQLMWQSPYIAMHWLYDDDLNFDLGLGCCLSIQPPMGFAGNHL